MMILTIALAALAAVAIVATVRQVMADGYHREPTH